MKTFTIIVLSLTLITISFAQVPQLVNYQGKLDSAGVPLSGTRNLTFKIYDAATAGSTLWTELQANVAIANGIFNVLLGSVTPFTGGVFGGTGERYLGVTVGTGTEMAPRYRITSTAFSIRAASADYVLFQKNPILTSQATTPSILSLTTTAQTARTLAFTAPMAGKILVTASGFLEMVLSVSTPTYATVNLTNISTPTAVYGDGIIVLRTPNTLPAGSYFTIPWSVTRVFTVTGSGSVYVHGKIESSSNSGSLYVSSMSVLFVPD